MYQISVGTNYISLQKQKTTVPSRRIEKKNVKKNSFNLKCPSLEQRHNFISWRRGIDLHLRVINCRWMERDRIAPASISAMHLSLTLSFRFLLVLFRPTCDQSICRAFSKLSPLTPSRFFLFVPLWTMIRLQRIPRRAEPSYTRTIDRPRIPWWLLPLDGPEKRKRNGRALRTVTPASSFTCSGLIIADR